MLLLVPTVVTSSSIDAIKKYEPASDDTYGKDSPFYESFLVKADSAKISQVVSNLISNALISIRLRHDIEQGKIIISIIRGNEIIISIQDNGQGIPPEVLSNLFTKFVTGSDSGYWFRFVHI